MVSKDCILRKCITLNIKAAYNNGLNFNEEIRYFVGQNLMPLGIKCREKFIEKNSLTGAIEKPTKIMMRKDKIKRDRKICFLIIREYRKTNARAK
jgi:hypothetical protein